MDRKFITASSSFLCAAAALLVWCGEEFEIDIGQPSEDAVALVPSLLEKIWTFALNSPKRVYLTSNRGSPSFRLEESRPVGSACAGIFPSYSTLPASSFPGTPVLELTFLSYYVSSDGATFKGHTKLDYAGGMTNFATTVLARQDGNLQLYALGRNTTSRGEDEGLWAAAVGPELPLHSFQKVSDAFPWSLTAALTPGGHHVRLYLETEGKIKTMISEKDNFVRFHSEGSPVFYDLSNSRLPDLTLRDPNITVNDLGVYALTWDNRDPKIGPGDEFDDVLTSPTFGLAFSVDGLEWTVYSNEMTVDGLKRDVSRGVTATGAVRHVVPVFLTNEQIRLYFSYGIRTYTSGVPGGSGISWSCSLGTAISN